METVLEKCEAPPIAPRGAVEYFGSLPFLGALAVSAEEVRAGSVEEIVLDYTVGAAGLADGGSLKIAFRYYSDWEPFQTGDPQQPGFLSARILPRKCFRGESESSGRRVRIRYDELGHERPFQKAVLVSLVDGYLKPGDVIRVILGDRSRGSVGSRVQTFVESRFRFRGFVDTAGSSRFAEVPTDIELAIRPGPPEFLRILGPRLLRPAAGFRGIARLEDAWGNVCEGATQDATCAVRWTTGETTETSIAWTNSPWSVAAIEAPRLSEGNHDITVSCGPLTATARLSVLSDAPVIRFGDLHIHADDTVGTGSLDWNLSFAREASGLDFAGYTANDFQITDAAWREAVKEVHRTNDPERFVVFPGVEWCGASAAGGDRNVIFLGEETPFPSNEEKQTLRSFEWHERSGRRPERGCWPVSSLHEALGGRGDVLMIPHVGGRRAIWDWHDPRIERLVEVCSSWGQFEWFYREALSRGARVGASGAGDEHRGRPGGGAPGASTFGVRGGLTGVISDGLDRSALGQALRSRHTWATTGERHVALLSTDGAIQGDTVTTDGAATLRYRLFGTRGWEYAALKDHRGTLHEWLAEYRKPSALRIRWGGARHKDRYRAAVWKGSLAIQNGSLDSVEASGFEHPGESFTVRDNTVTWNSETYGDTDAIVVTFAPGEPPSLHIRQSVFAPARHGIPEEPWTQWQAACDLQDILAGPALHVPLPGQDLFLALEAAPSDNLPLEIEGAWTLQVHPNDFGFHPVYLHARDAGGGQVWTSPIFLETK
jgi:hypothetical protein